MVVASPWAEGAQCGGPRGAEAEPSDQEPPLRWLLLEHFCSVCCGSEMPVHSSVCLCVCVSLSVGLAQPGHRVQGSQSLRWAPDPSPGLITPLVAGHGDILADLSFSPWGTG